MRHYNGWLWGQLREKYGDAVDTNYGPLISIEKRKFGIATQTHRIWCPTPDDYKISRDCVAEVHEIGGNIISYATTWSRPSEEGKLRARELGILIMPHGATIAYFE